MTVRPLLHTLCLGLLALVSSRCLADLRLLQAVDLKPSGLKSPAALYVSNANDFSLVDRDTGLWWRYSGGIPQKVLLGAKGAAFDTKEISGMTRLEDGRWVAVTDDDDIGVVFDDQGHKLSRFAASGSGPGELKSPMAIAASGNGRFYVADKRNDRIAVFSQDGTFLTAIGDDLADEKQRLDDPIAVAVDAEENVYALDSGGRLSVFSGQGVLQRQFRAEDWKYGAGKPAKMVAMTADRNGLVYLADSANSKVLQWDWHNGKALESFGSAGKGRGQFSEVSALSARSDGVLAVLDTGNSKVEIYQMTPAKENLTAVRWSQLAFGGVVKSACALERVSNDGNRLCLDSKQKKIISIDGAGSNHDLISGLSKPKNLFVSPEHIVVAEESALKIYERSGKFLLQLGRSGSEDGAFHSPKAVLVSQGRIWVADTGNSRVQAFTLDGIFVGKTGVEKTDNGTRPIIHEPSALVADSKGNLYVADGKTHRIKVFNRALEFQYELTPNGAAFTDIYDMAADSDDQVYALVKTDHNDYSVHVWYGRNEILQFGQEGSNDSGMQHASALSVANAGKTTAYVFDEKRQALLAFNVLSIPARVGGVKVSGSNRGTQLRWQPAVEHYVTGYRIYGWRNNEAPLRLQDSKETSTLVPVELANVDWYAVKAISGHGVESDLSQAWPDRFANGKRWFEQNEFDKALTEFDASVNDAPDNIDAITMLARTYAKLNRFDEALRSFDRLSELPEQGNTALQLKLETLVSAKRYLDARALLEKVLANKPVNVQAYWWCAEINNQLNDPVGAISCLEEILRRNPAELEAKLQLGKTYLAAGAVDPGLKQLDEALAMAPQDKNVMLVSAEQLRLINRNDQALARYQQILVLDPQSAEAQLGIGKTQLALGQLDLAKTNALNLATHPTLGQEGSLLLGEVALAQKQPQEALLAFGRVLRGNAKNARALVGLADVYVALSQPDNELEQLHKAVVADPSVVAIWVRLGQRERVAQHLDASLDALGHAATLAPHSILVLPELARTEFVAGHLNEARSHIQEALNQKTTAVDLWQLQTDIAARQGKLTDAIESAKKALALATDSLDLSLRLAGLYVDTYQLELAEPLVDKIITVRKDYGAAYAIKARVMMARHQYDKAIPVAEKAAALDPSEDNKSLVNSLLAERKRNNESQQTAASLALDDLKLNPIFSAAYKVYARQSIGSVKVRNTGAAEWKNLQLTFSIKGYMDFPYSAPIASLAPKASVEIPLYATFNNHILDVDEDTGVQVEVAIGSAQSGGRDAVVQTRPTTLYGKNAITWSQPDMVGAFVTPRDDLLRDFVRQSLNLGLPKTQNVNKNVLMAMTYFSALTAHGLHYQPDPNSPYSRLSANQVDYVQFPRETLRLKSGDCDDLSVLMAAGLENLGIDTQLVDVPGHLFMIFNTGLPASERDSISLDPDLALDIDGEAWVPVETTLIATSFSEAWAEGARKFRVNRDKGSLKLLSLHNAWQMIPPVTLAPAAYTISQPAEDRVRGLVEHERDMLLAKSMERLIEPYRVMAANGGDIRLANLQIAIQYAKAGLYDKALEQLDSLLHDAPQYSAAHIATGNVYYLRKDYARALDAYALAERLEPDNAGIKINVALSLYGLQQLKPAAAKYREAIAMDAGLSKRYETLGKLLAN